VPAAPLPPLLAPPALASLTPPALASLTPPVFASLTPPVLAPLVFVPPVLVPPFPRPPAPAPPVPRPPLPRPAEPPVVRLPSGSVANRRQRPFTMHAPESVALDRHIADRPRVAQLAWVLHSSVQMPHTHESPSPHTASKSQPWSQFGFELPLVGSSPHPETIANTKGVIATAARAREWVLVSMGISFTARTTERERTPTAV
jgi:hypothetical protein